MPPRSFRARLTWFFVVIVVIPMVVVAAVVFRLITSAEEGKSDARLALAQTAAGGLFRSAERSAAAAGRRIAASPELARAIAGRDAGAVQAQLRRIVRRAGVARVELGLPGGLSRVAGAPDAVAPAATTLVTGGDRRGVLRVSTQTAGDLVDAIRDVTGMDALLVAGGRTVAATRVGAGLARLPRSGQATIGDREYRVAPPLEVPAWTPGRRLAVRLLEDARLTRSGITGNSLVVGALLVAFLLLAVLFALMVSRALQSQVHRLLQGARRLGAGELDVEVPTEGDDEFAALGAEFNQMARQLRGRLGELEAERERLRHAIRRVGESFAKNLDRDALLEIVVQTAVDGVAASVGRAAVRTAPGGPLERRALVGARDGFGPVLDAVEAAAIEGRTAADLRHGDVYALCHPLQSEQAGRVLGLISVARRDQPFSAAELELFNYLAGQASVSIENVDLHETVQRQAVTDELTGLSNHRRFQEVMTAEVERSRRFGQPLALIMLDVDDFKAVNDRHGHLQGDQVLREVARVLLASSREIDEPARYGGEELAIALPQTDLAGAELFAERLRARIEALEIPLVGGDGMVRVTASLGAAALPESSAADKAALVAAADAALYRAKRLGKNRVVRAG